MGINFGMNVAKKVGNKFVRVFRTRVPGAESLYTQDTIFDSELPKTGFDRHAFYFTLFREFREKVEKLAKEKLYFDFYDHEIEFTDPEKIIYTLEKLKEIFTKYQEDFPFYYAWKSEKSDYIERHFQLNLWVNGEIKEVICTIDKGNNTCHLFNEKGKVEKILSEGEKVKGCMFNYKEQLRPDEISKDDKIVKSKSGEELVLFDESTYIIVKENVYERHIEEFEALMELLNFAKKKGYYVSTTIQ